MTVDDTWTRLVRYAYVEEWLAGREVLEIGCGDGGGAAFLADRAARVIAGDPSPEVASRARMRTTRPNLAFRAIDPFGCDLGDAAFDLVSVPSAEAWLRDPRFLAEVRRLLRPGGLLYVGVPSSDRPGSSTGMGYHELVALLSRAFSTVRPLAQTPGVHFTLTEFSPDGEIEPRLDGSLLDDPEPCTHYLALCGDGDVPRPGYGVVVVPRAALAEGDEPGRAAEVVRLEARAAQAEAHVDLLARELREERGRSRRAPDEPARADADLRARLSAAEERCAALEAERQADRWRVEEAGGQAARRDLEIEALREGAGRHQAEALRLQSELADLRAFSEEMEGERRTLEAERARLTAELEAAAARRSELELEVGRRGMRIAEMEGAAKGQALRDEASRP
jgi:SAM-dependent methyltransferase